MSRFISLSSTNSILAICGFLSSLDRKMSSGLGGRFRMHPMFHEFTNLIEQLVATVIALLQNLLDIAFELLAVFHGQIFGRQDDHRNVPQLRVFPQFSYEIEAVHDR